MGFSAYTAYGAEAPWNCALGRESQSDLRKNDRIIYCSVAGEYELCDSMLRSIIERYQEHIDAIHHLSLIAEGEGRELKHNLLEKEAVERVLQNLPKDSN